MVNNEILRVQSKLSNSFEGKIDAVISILSHCPF